MHATMWLLLGLFVGAAYIVYEIVTAPEGYEDAAGFHYGKPDKSRQRQQRLQPSPSLQADEPRSQQRDEARDQQDHGEVVIVHHPRIA